MKGSDPPTPTSDYLLGALDSVPAVLLQRPKGIDFVIFCEATMKKRAHVRDTTD